MATLTREAGKLEEAIALFYISDDSSIEFTAQLSGLLEDAHVPIETAASIIADVPQIFRTGSIDRYEKTVFTPSRLLDHVANVFYTGFNLFDLFTEKGYAKLRVPQTGEELTFVLLRGQDEDYSKYCLAIYDANKELVAYRSHYVRDETYISGAYIARAVQGFHSRFKGNFPKGAQEFGVEFTQPHHHGIWVNESMRRRRIGRTLDAIASTFIPAAMLDIQYAKVRPGGYGSREFYDAMGYDDEEGDYAIAYTSNQFPEITILPGQTAHRTTDNDKTIRTWNFALMAQQTTP